MNMDEENKNNGAAEPVVVPENDLAAKLKDCEVKRDEYLAGWQRAKADFINYKKEEIQRLEEMARYGNEELIYEVIMVLDSFDLGLRALEKAGPIEKGIYMIRTQLEDVLKRRGVTKIPISPGSPFDPAFAEAVAEADPPGPDYPPGSVIEEIESGYKLHGKILRPARVKIAKGKIDS